MTTELDIARQDSHAEIVPARPKAGTAAAAMDMLREHAEMMSMAYDLAKSMVGTTMVPKIYQPKNETDKEREKAAQNATAAILYGLELGLNPIQSLQQVFPVNNSPAIYAKTMVALLKAKGYKFRTDEAGPERCTVTGWWPGEEPETSTWDIERATRAGFVPTIDPETGKYKTKKFSGPNGQYEKIIGNEKYITQPEELLWAKAATTVCRRLAPDVLLGIGRTVEDLESETEPDPDPVRVRSERVQVAEILAEEAAAEAPKVQQWQAPAEDATPPAEPEPTQDEAPADPPKRTKKADLDEATALMNQIGLTAQDDRRRFVRELFKDESLTAAALTAEQRAYLLTELRGILAEREGRDSVAEATIAADAGQQTLDTEGGAQ